MQRFGSLMALICTDDTDPCPASTAGGVVQRRCPRLPAVSVALYPSIGQIREDADTPILLSGDPPIRHSPKVEQGGWISGISGIISALSDSGSTQD